MGLSKIAGSLIVSNSASCAKAIEKKPRTTMSRVQRFVNRILTVQDGFCKCVGKNDTRPQLTCIHDLQAL